MMNERIQELIEQASVRGQVYLPGDDGHPSPTFYFDKEKFAELIVRECAKVVDDKLDFENASGPDDWASGADVLAHFGVEE